MMPPRSHVNDPYKAERFLPSLEEAISSERFATYLAHVDGDREQALRLYEWNIAASAAFYFPLQALEVCLRNACHRRLQATYGVKWYQTEKLKLDWQAQDRIRKVLSNSNDPSRPKEPPDVVAALSFGFWVSLFGPGGHTQPYGRGPRANYEMTLWRPALRGMFKGAQSLRRKDLHRSLNYLRNFRNRVAHHEPIFKRHLEKDYDSIIRIVGWIYPEQCLWIEQHSRVRQILDKPYNTPQIRI